MESGLTREERAAIRRINRNRVVLSLILTILIIAVVADAILIASEFDPDDLPEWLIFPITLGIGAVAAAIGLIVYMGGRLRDKEKAGFVWASIRSLRSANLLSISTEKKIFRDLAGDLIRKPGVEVADALVVDGWPRARAEYFTMIVEALIAKSEWNIGYEDQVADFSQFLGRIGWGAEDIEALVQPVIKEIKTSGGRLLKGRMAASVGKNILWIVIILVIALGALWLLVNDKGLPISKKYEYLKFIILAVPTVVGLGINIAAIIRKLGRKPTDSGRK